MMNYENMSDFEINRAVAEALGADIVNYMDDGSGLCVEFKGRPPTDVDYCKKPADAWPVILENKISVTNELGEWVAMDGFKIEDGVAYCNNWETDKNPIRAAMIVFLMMQEAK